MLVFVGPMYSLKTDNNWLEAFLETCWKKVDGKVYLIFEEKLSQLHQSPINEFFDREYLRNNIVSTVDWNGNARNYFGIREMPCAIQLDEAVVVKKVGVPITSIPDEIGT